MSGQQREATGAPPSLLAQFMYRPLEPGYASAARRKKQGGQPRKRRTSLLVAVLAVLLGAATAAAAVNLSTPSPDAAATRLSLERQVRLAQADVSALERRVQTLSGEVSALRDGGPAPVSAGQRAALVTEGAEAGTVPVAGPGLMVTLSDAASNDPDSAVQDFDLQNVVDALWSGGAEAVAINGERLTSLSAIRNAGSAILVNLTPVTGPYRVEAIGDADALQVALTRTGTSDLLQLLGSKYGITSSVVPQTSMSLPAAPLPTLYYAKPTSVDSASGESSAAASKADATTVSDREGDE